MLKPALDSSSPVEYSVTRRGQPFSISATRFRCVAHKDCKVRMRLVSKGEHAFYIEKLRDTKHSSVIAVFDRKNAECIRMQ
jgi:hypothetical protein